KKRRKQDFEMFDCQTENQSRTLQFLTCMQEIKLQGCEQRRRDEWEECQNRLFGVQKRNLDLRQAQEAGSVFINELKDILITVVAATAVIEGRITLGTMLAIQYMVGQLSGPVSRMMEFIYTMQDVRISLERINEVHDAKNEEETQCRRKEFEGDDRSIRIESLRFRYNPHSLSPTLDDINIEIPSRSTIAIVGASGSGKTTLVKMILGYYRPECGQITVGGVPIADLDLKWLRSRCGTVMQDGVIFSESIARNIAVDDGDIDISRMRTAASIANIAAFIESQPQGYDTIIGLDGIGISQGQKQRILIARAIYRNPDFIFLDEATNSLDAENERLIVERMRNVFKGKTVVVVAHRLSTVMDADKIIVIDKGRVAECGDHKSLIKKRGIYYNLVRNQLELGN
ncbi:MAG: ATP-binding cassette domain-containing protein, partial [Bacteroides sp.]|nr:ATP-binding cassette domain-containing protein [Bacteroides sp.]